MNLKLATNGAKSSSHPILIGLGYTFGLVMIIAVLFAFILQFTSLSDSHLPLVSYIVTAISLLTGGYQAGKKAGEKGWYYGGIIGLIYGIILAAVSYLGFNLAFNLRNITILLLSFLFAAFGGIIGVNRNN